MACLALSHENMHIVKRTCWGRSCHMPFPIRDLLSVGAASDRHPDPNGIE